MEGKSLTLNQKSGIDRGYIRGIGSYFAQIWHATGHDQVPFYPLWFNQFLNRKLPVILDTNNLMLVYSSIPRFRTILDYKGSLLRQAKIRLFEVEPDGTDGEEIFNHPVLKLLKNPNPVLRGDDFMVQWCLMWDLYQTALIYKNKVTRSGLPISLMVMPTGEFKINPTGLLFDQLDINNIIENYEHINSLYPHAAPKYYKPSEIMRYIDGPTDRYFFGIPKIITNKLIASNLQCALQTRNVLLNDMGARGILSNSGGDSEGGLPLTEVERMRLEKAYRSDYGISEDQSKVLITQSSLKWQPMSFPTKDLLAFEEEETCFTALCDIYGLQRKLFGEGTASKAKETIGGDGKGNIEEAMKITIETTIQETIDTFLEGFNCDPDFGLIQNGKQILVLRGTFDHLPVMQEDQVDAENVKNVKAQAANTYTQAVISLQGQINSGGMTQEAALAILVNLFGMEEEIANEVITEKQEQPEEDNENDTEEDKKFKKKLKNFKL